MTTVFEFGHCKFQNWWEDRLETPIWRRYVTARCYGNCVGATPTAGTTVVTGSTIANYASVTHPTTNRPASTLNPTLTSWTSSTSDTVGKRSFSTKLAAMRLTDQLNCGYVMRNAVFLSFAVAKVSIWSPPIIRLRLRGSAVSTPSSTWSPRWNTAKMTSSKLIIIELI